MSTLFLFGDESVTRILHLLPSVIQSEVEKELRKVEEERGVSVTYLPHARFPRDAERQEREWVDLSHPSPESHSKIAQAIFRNAIQRFDGTFDVSQSENF